MKIDILKKENNYFEKQKNSLLGQAKGEFALIHEEDLIDTFKSKDDAIKRGFEKLGNTPFLVKLITEVEETLNFTNHFFC